MTAAAGPDFLCVGMQKAGTGWLYDQLQHHRDFWMPAVKELHYFDRAYPDARMLETIEKRRIAKRMTLADGWRELNADDAVWFERARQAFLKPTDLDTYASLFDFKNGRVTGDITPAYCALPDPVVEGIARRFPNLKVALLVRDPISRLWSQVAMNDRRGKFDGELLDNGPGLLAHIGKRSIAQRSFATKSHALWSRHIPPDRLRVFFFDDIVQRPDVIRADIIRFLGGDPAYQGSIEAGFNRKASMPKVPMSDTARKVLVEYFREELLAGRERFGGHAAKWCETYGVS